MIDFSRPHGAKDTDQAMGVQDVTLVKDEALLNGSMQKFEPFFFFCLPLKGISGIHLYAFELAGPTHLKLPRFDPSCALLRRTSPWTS